MRLWNKLKERLFPPDAHEEAGYPVGESWGPDGRWVVRPVDRVWAHGYIGTALDGSDDHIVQSLMETGL